MARRSTPVTTRARASNPRDSWHEADCAARREGHVVTPPALVVGIGVCESRPADASFGAIIAGNEDVAATPPHRWRTAGCPAVETHVQLAERAVDRLTVAIVGLDR
jgi:hypothetical protein